MNKTEEEKASAHRIVGITALILEDRTGQVDSVEKVIKSSLKSINLRKIGVDLELSDLIQKKTKKEVLDYVEQGSKVPDWLLCDLNLPEKGAGREVAREILHRRYPTDILLYSYREVLDRDEKIGDGRYGNIIIANRDQIEASIDRLVWRAVVKFPDPEYLRGLILSRATETESLIDDCLVSLFEISDVLKYHFKWGLLRSESYGPGVKYGVFESYLKNELDNGLAGAPVELDKNKDHLKTHWHLVDIFRIRNLVAHGLAESDGAGGLVITDRLDTRKKVEYGDEKEEVQPNQSIPRDEIKHYLYLCYKTNEELSKLSDFVKKLK